jgi:hypothetical protein
LGTCLTAEVLEIRALLSSSTPSYAALVAAHPAPPALGDAGFEAVNVGNSFQYGPNDPGGWTFPRDSAQGGSGVSGIDSGFTVGSPPPPEGTQVAFLQKAGVISQSVNNWSSGWYNVSFDAAQRASQYSAENFQVQVDGHVVGTFRPDSTSYQSFTTNAISVGGGTHTIRFVGLNTAGGDNTAFIDAVSIGTATPPTVPALFDPGFEVVPEVNSYQYGPMDPGGWTFPPNSIAGGSGVSGIGTGFTVSSPPPPEGTQVAFLQKAGVISQTVNNWSSGWYNVSFDAAQRASQYSAENFQVQVDGHVVGIFRPDSTSYQSFTTNVFSVGGGTHTIRFAGLNTPGGDNTAFIDAVAINTTSPPTVPALFDAGFEIVPEVNSYQYGPTDPGGWTFPADSVHGGPGVSGIDTGFTVGSPSPPEGTQVAFLQKAGVISQTVNNWSSGWYNVSFDAAQRASQYSAENFQVQVDGHVVGTFRPDSTSYHSFTTNAFYIGGGSHTIRFAGLNTPGGDNTAFIDAVAINTASPPTVPALSDPGFEVVPVGNGYQYGPYDPSGWEFTPYSGLGFPSGSGVSGNDSGFTGGLPPTPNGTQVAFLQGTATITQKVANWTAGWYTISFDAAQRANWGSIQDFAVQVDGVVVGTFTPVTMSYLSYTTNPFYVGAGNHTIRFVGLNSVQGDSTAFIDAVSVAVFSHA